MPVLVWNSWPAQSRTRAYAVSMSATTTIIFSGPLRRKMSKSTLHAETLMEDRLMAPTSGNTGLSPEEALAFAVLGRVLGVTIDHYDRAGRQNAIDGVMTYPDGQTAALEVSSLGDEEEARITNVLRRKHHRLEIPGLLNAWYVSVPTSFSPRDLPNIGTALLECEAAGWTSLRDAGHAPGAASRLSAEGVSAFVMPLAGTGAVMPVAYTYADMPGGRTTNGMANLPTELAEVLDTALIKSRTAKLANHGISEQHLFLYIRPSAFTFEVYDALMWGGELPTTHIALPSTLSSVWLCTGWAAGGTVQATANGWYRHQPLDN
jgi:hypothetical protein